MYFLIFSLVFLALAGLAYLLGSRKGAGYIWQFSVSRIILNVASALVATALSGFVALGLSKALLDSFKDMPALNSIRNLGLGISIDKMMAVVVASISAAIVFVPFFVIARCIVRVALKAVTKLMVKFTEKAPVERASAVNGKKAKKYSEFKTAKKDKLGAICGGICGVITFMVLCIPAVGALDTVNDIAYNALDASDSAAVETVAEVMDASANNVGAFAVKYTGGKLLFNAMTYCEIDETSTDTVKEDLETVGNIAAVAQEYDLLSTLTSSPKKALMNEECTSKILLLILENPRLSPAIDAVSDFAVKVIFDSVGVPSEIDPMYDEFVGRMAAVNGSDADALADEYGKVFDAYGLRVDESKNVLAAEARLAGADMRAWTQENIVGDKQEFIDKTELVSVQDVIEGRTEILDPEHEAKALAHAFAVLCEMADDMGASNMQSILSKLGPALDAFSESETLGEEKTKYLLIGLLQSNKIHDEIGLSVLDATDTAISICENSKETGYEPMLLSLAKAIEVVSSASDPGKNTSEAVKLMLDDLTPASSRVLQTMTTPSVVKSYNVPEKSAGPVSSMLSDTFGNLADAKEQGMSDEEYEKESAAVSNMMDVLMASGKSGSTVFGEGSVTGVTAEEYVNNMMDSKVMSGTVMDNVYVDGENATRDPLNSERNMSEQEKAEFLDAISNRWEGSDKDEVTEKKLVSIAAVLNFQIELTDGGFAEVAPQQ